MARRTWPYSAAWTLRYGKRTAIGVKPPRLLKQSDKRFGVRMLVEEKDMPTTVTFFGNKEPVRWNKRLKQSAQ